MPPSTGGGEGGAPGGNDGSIGQTISVSKGNNDVDITQVTLTVAGTDIVQNSPHSGNPISGWSPVIFKTITLDDNGTTVVAAEFNTGSVDIFNLNYPGSASSIVSTRNGSISTGLSSPNFEGNTEAILSSTNLRQYLDYTGTSQDLIDSPFDFDFFFDKSLKAHDYLVVMEKHGNSTFELTPIDYNGNVIDQANTLKFKASYAWNTGFSSNASSNQAFHFTVVDIEKFGVDTASTPIKGFRLNNDGHADMKFFTMSASPFDTRPPDPEPDSYLPKTVTARVYPPSGLCLWFDPSSSSGETIGGSE